MSTVRDLIKDSLLLIGAISPGETPTAAEQSDALRSLNRMMGSWAAEGLMIFTHKREVFLLTPGQSIYTMGPLANFNSVRPSKIYSAASSDANVQTIEVTPAIPGDPLADPPIADIPAVTVTTVNSVYENPVKILNIQEWVSISDKTLQSDYVQKIYVDAYAPIININVWPVPLTAKALVLYSQKPFDNFVSADDEVSFPPGFEEAIVYNLAVRNAPSYGKVVSPEVVAIANESKANATRNVFEPTFMRSEFTTCKSPNIFSGS